jgi:hypothetical protein
MFEAAWNGAEFIPSNSGRRGFCFFLSRQKEETIELKPSSSHPATHLPQYDTGIFQKIDSAH